MTIKSIIEKYYDTLLQTCSKDKAVSQSRTEEDILNDVCLTAMQKYHDKDIDENDGLFYLKKSLYAEKQFQYARKATDKLDYFESMETFDKIDE